MVAVDMSLVTKPSILRDLKKKLLTEGYSRYKEKHPATHFSKKTWISLPFALDGPSDEYEKLFLLAASYKLDVDKHHMNLCLNEVVKNKIGKVFFDVDDYPASLEPLLLAIHKELYALAVEIWPDCSDVARSHPLFDCIVCAKKDKDFWNLKDLHIVFPNLAITYNGKQPALFAEIAEALLCSSFLKDSFEKEGIPWIGKVWNPTDLNYEKTDTTRSILDPEVIRNACMRMIYQRNAFKPESEAIYEIHSVWKINESIPTPGADDLYYSLERVLPDTERKWGRYSIQEDEGALINNLKITSLLYDVSSLPRLDTYGEKQLQFDGDDLVVEMEDKPNEDPIVNSNNESEEESTPEEQASKKRPRDENDDEDDARTACYDNTADIVLEEEPEKDFEIAGHEPFFAQVRNREYAEICARAKEEKWPIKTFMTELKKWLNKHLCLVDTSKGPQVVYRTYDQVNKCTTIQIVTIANARAMVNTLGKFTIDEVKRGPDGDIIRKKTIKPFSVWYNDPNKVHKSGVGFFPIPKELRTPEQNRLLNTWQGWRWSKEECINAYKNPVYTERADWIDDHWFKNLCNGDLETFIYVIRWISTLFHHPVPKIPVMIIFVCGEGSGKTIVWVKLGEMFGVHFWYSANPNRALKSQFNAYSEENQLTLFDELCWLGGDQSSASLKSLITEKMKVVEAKGKDQRLVSNWTNYVGITNADNMDGQVVPAKEGARRYVLIEGNPATEARSMEPAEREVWVKKLVSCCNDDDSAGYKAWLGKRIFSDEIIEYHKNNNFLIECQKLPAACERLLAQQKFIGANSVQQFWMDCINRKMTVHPLVDWLSQSYFKTYDPQVTALWQQFPQGRRTTDFECDVDGKKTYSYAWLGIVCWEQLYHAYTEMWNTGQIVKTKTVLYKESTFISMTIKLLGLDENHPQVKVHPSVMALIGIENDTVYKGALKPTPFPVGIGKNCKIAKLGSWHKIRERFKKQTGLGSLMIEKPQDAFKQMMPIKEEPNLDDHSQDSIEGRKKRKRASNLTIVRGDCVDLTGEE